MFCVLTEKQKKKERSARIQNKSKKELAVMWKFIRGKGQQPLAERQKLQKELFAYKKVKSMTIFTTIHKLQENEGKFNKGTTFTCKNIYKFPLNCAWIGC